MPLPASAMPLDELRQRLEATPLTPREICSLFHNPTFRSIEYRTDQLTFLRNWASDQRLHHIDEKALSLIYGIRVGNLRKILLTGRKRPTDLILISHRPTSLTPDQEHILVQVILDNAAQSKFLRKGEVLREVENRFGTVFTYQWVNGFLNRHTEAIVRDDSPSRRSASPGSSSIS
jgi:hypothetical protein